MLWRHLQLNLNSVVKIKGRIKTKKKSKEKTDKNESNDEKCKPRYPCYICDEDHFTKKFPCRDDVSKFVKGSPIHVFLKDPFPTQDSNMIGSSSTTLEEPIMMMSYVRVATRL